MIPDQKPFLRILVFVSILFGITHIGVTLLDKSIMPVAAAASQPATASQPAAPTKFILDPFATPDWIGESDLIANFFGTSVASAGDVNGDGYADVIVGAPYYQNGQTMEGRAYVFHGSATGLKHLPAWAFESNIVECELGWSVASAGDVNGDGFDDVLVGALYCSPTPVTDNREGRAYLFLGSAAGLSPTPAWMIQGGSPQESLGWSVATAGDVNNDGYGDVIVGAPWASYPEGNEGRAYVFYGSASGLSTTADWIKESNIPWSGFGVSVASAGDVNGDGYDDVIIGHDYKSNPEEIEGQVYVYLGSDAGLADMPVWTFENNHAGSQLGESVASAGDVNGDGFGDVLVGGFHYSSPSDREGIAYLFLGSATGELAPSWSMESNHEFAEFGHSVASAGDVNLDGFDDVLIGAPFFHNGETSEGAAFLYYGSASGLLTAPVWKTEGNQVAAEFGCSVASAGDVNGDGIPDIIVGARYYDGGQADEGRAIVYHGIADAKVRIVLPMIVR